MPTPKQVSEQIRRQAQRPLLGRVQGAKNLTPSLSVAPTRITQAREYGLKQAPWTRRSYTLYRDAEVELAPHPVTARAFGLYTGSIIYTPIQADESGGFYDRIPVDEGSAKDVSYQIRVFARSARRFDMHVEGNCRFYAEIKHDGQEAPVQLAKTPNFTEASLNIRLHADTWATITLCCYFDQKETLFKAFHGLSDFVDNWEEVAVAQMADPVWATTALETGTLDTDVGSSFVDLRFLPPGWYGAEYPDWLVEQDLSKYGIYRYRKEVTPWRFADLVDSEIQEHTIVPYKRYGGGPPRDCVDLFRAGMDLFVGEDEIGEVVEAIRVPANYIYQNASFEVWPTNWSVTTSGSPSVTTTSGDARWGDYSLWASGNAADLVHVESAYFRRSETDPTLTAWCTVDQAFAPYTIRFWYKVTAGQGPKLEIYYYDNDNNLLGTDTLLVPLNEYVDWSEYAVSIYAHSDTHRERRFPSADVTRMRFRYYLMDNPGEITNTYVDGFTVSRCRPGYGMDAPFRRFHELHDQTWVKLDPTPILASGIITSGDISAFLFDGMARETLAPSDVMDIPGAAEGDLEQVIVIRDTEVQAGEAYIYTIDAVGRSGNRSPKTTLSSPITAGDTTAPAEVAGLAATAGVECVTLNWTNPADLDFRGANIYKDSVSDANLLATTYGLPGKKNSFTLGGLTAGVQVTFLVNTFDHNKNPSGGSGTVNATPTSASGAGLWAANGADIYNTNAGDVGINDNTPTHRLDVNGTFRAVGAATFDSTLTVAGATALNGNTTIGNAAGDALTFHPSAWTLSNAVTITGTWADLGIVTTVDINGGSIDGTAIGGGTPAAGAFTTLAASGNVSFDGGTFIFNTSEADLDFRFAGDNETNLLYGDAGNDRIGIGTAAPRAHLEVTKAGTDSRGIVYISGYNDQVTYTPSLHFLKSHTDTPASDIETVTTEQLGYIGFNGVDSGPVVDEGAHIYAIQDGAAGARVPTNLIFETYSSTALNANQLFLYYLNGNVGIGGNNPGNKLTVTNAAAQGTAYFAHGEATVSAVTIATDKYGLYIEGATAGADELLEIKGNGGGTDVLTAYADGDVALAGVKYTWPAADGNASEVLGTNGALTLSWVAGPVTGNGTQDYIPKWSGATALTDSIIYESGNKIGIGTTTLTGLFNTATSNAVNYTYFETFDDGASYSVVQLGKSDTDVIGSYVQTDSGDNLGVIVFAGVNTTPAPDYGAYILAQQDGAAGTKVPTNLIFNTYSSTAVNSNQLVLHNDGKIGMGTAVIPHGGIGMALLALEGTNASTAGPHVQFTTAADDYPLLQFMNWQHDLVAIGFDAWYAGGASWGSSDAGSNFMILKQNDKFYIQYDSGIAQGAAITWNSGIVMDTSGNVGFGISPDAWYTATPYTALNIGGTGSIFCATSRSATRQMAVGQNVYLNAAANYIYMVTDEASFYQQHSGTHNFYTAVSGTAGNAISWGTAKLVIIANGNVGIGTATPAAPLHINDNEYTLIIGTATGFLANVYDDISPGNVGVLMGGGAAVPATLHLHSNYVSGNRPSRILFSTARSNTFDAPTAANNGDCIGHLTWIAADGVDFDTAAASIRAYVDGAVGSNDTPGRLQFYTTADGSRAPSVRMTILSGGNVGIGTATPAEPLDITLSDATAYSSTQAHGDPGTALVVRNSNASADHVSIDFYVRPSQVGNARIVLIREALESHIAFQQQKSTDAWHETMRIEGDGNVGINDITPTHKLDVNGTVRATGAVTLDSTLGVTGDVNVDNGVLFVDVSENRVGINDASPSYSLDVKGEGYFSSDVAIGTTFNLDGRLVIGKANATTDVYVDCYDDGLNCGQLTFRKSDTDTLGTWAQTDDGDILGVVQFLGVNGTPASTWGAVIYAVQIGATAAFVPTDIYFRCYSEAGPQDVMIVSHEKRIGINVDPSYTFHIENAAVNTYAAYIDSSASSVIFAIHEDANGNGILYVADSTGYGAVKMAADNSTSQIVIDHAANYVLRLQNNNAGLFGAFLEFFHNSGSPADNDFLGGMEFFGEDSASNKDHYGSFLCSARDVSTTTEDASFNWYLIRAGSFELQMYLLEDGNLYIDGTYETFSDIRLKRDIKPITDALSLLSELEGIYYHRSDMPAKHDRRLLGLSAQDVQDVLPEAVNVGQNGMLTLNYDGFVPVLVNAVNELNANYNELDTKILSIEDQLRQKIVTLEDEVSILQGEVAALKQAA